MNSIPPLDDKDWVVHGDSLVAWLSPLMFFEIAPGKVYGFDLSLNHTGTVATEPLGSHADIDAAKLAARRHLGDE